MRLNATLKVKRGDIVRTIPPNMLAAFEARGYEVVKHTAPPPVEAKKTGEAKGKPGPKAKPAPVEDHPQLETEQENV